MNFWLNVLIFIVVLIFYMHLQNEWKKGDVLMWDNMGTIHNAVADYLPTEHRYIKRCQVMATRFF